jgi:hypothetical protein
MGRWKLTVATLDAQLRELEVERSRLRETIRRMKAEADKREGIIDAREVSDNGDGMDSGDGGSRGSGEEEESERSDGDEDVTVVFCGRQIGSRDACLACGDVSCVEYECSEAVNTTTTRVVENTSGGSDSEDTGVSSAESEEDEDEEEESEESDDESGESDGEDEGW